MSYAEDGFEVIGGVLAPGLIAEGRAAVERLVTRFRAAEEGLLSDGVSLADVAAQNPDLDPDVVVALVEREPYIIGDLLAHDPGFLPLFQDIGLWRIAARALGASVEDVVFHFSNITRKPPGVGPAIHWHRDFRNRYFRPIDGRFIRLILPLGEMSRRNGGTALVPGSHCICDEQALERPQPPEDELCLWPETTAGDVLLIHPKLLHGGEPNRSILPRDVIVLQFGVKGSAFAYQATERGALVDRAALLELPGHEVGAR